MASTSRAWNFAIVLAACWLAACEGGQTGQPNSPACTHGPVLVSSNDQLQGVSPAQLAQAFAGEYRAPLRWSNEGAAGTGMLAGDELTISIRYDGADGSTDDCSRLLSVPVHMSVTTRSGTINELADVLLAADVGTLSSVSFSQIGEGFAVSGVLSHTPGTPLMVGNVRASGANDNAGTAEFSSAFDSTGGTGGAQ